ncbi:hypothetical protein SNOG_04408 [Parastagonospora nodorum SN15]|uniref:Uncharacterized protein n=1 Tax=Phaeosphaeria nodorum (strain SN15 / ATCC MYA-4574 / FGSC 10173) TaxID=321614 RepID=Q0UV06_PHANO|nr:hypothetical protein SNOG_04408 [Parastagonospora nodorum SN15]EAT88168.2 hypothetical protein SNOG_04408 [Parastagonospora nodorum SN15]
MYCFRRERIIHAKHTYGTEAAKTIAGHVEGSNAHEHYDTVNVGDIDIQAYNACRESMSREDARKMFRQANQSLYNQTSSPKDYQTNLRKETDARVFDRERTNPELAASARCVGDEGAVEGQVGQWRHYRNSGGAPKAVNEDAKKARKEIDLVTNKRLAAVNSLLRENDSGAVVDEGVDERSDLNIDPDQVEEDEAIRNPKGEPGAWKFFEDNEEVVVIGVGHEGQDQKEAKGRVANDALDARKAFLLQHIAANECPTSGLTCILDPSSTAKARSKKWNRAQLHKHLRSKAHSC